MPPKNHSPSRALAIRVTVIALALLSMGILAWVPMLRVALLTRRATDWVLSGLTLSLDLVLVAYVGRPGTDNGTALDHLSIAVMLLLPFATSAYCVVAERRNRSPLPLEERVSKAAAELAQLTEQLNSRQQDYRA